jgi:hypothetical protein
MLTVGAANTNRLLHAVPLLTDLWSFVSALQGSHTGKD